MCIRDRLIGIYGVDEALGSGLLIWCWGGHRFLLPFKVLTLKIILSLPVLNDLRVISWRALRPQTQYPLVTLLRFEGTVTIRTQPGDKKTRDQSCTQEYNKRTAIRAGPIESGAHHQRPQSSRQTERSENRAVDSTECEQAKVPASHIGNEVYLCAQSESNEKHTRKSNRW